MADLRSGSEAFKNRGKALTRSRLCRHQLRAAGGRRDRRAQAGLRHLGEHRQRGLAHGVHRRRRPAAGHPRRQGGAASSLYFQGLHGLGLAVDSSCMQKDTIVEQALRLCKALKKKPDPLLLRDAAHQQYKI